ncbi:MAG: hypothetical protein COA78_36620, partial [Blastopirellula sp.]
MQKNNGNNKSKILIADDDPVTLKILERHLNTAGYSTICARDGREALDLIDETVSLALLDLEMPHVSGQECLEFIRDHFSEIPVIIISSTGQVQQAVKSIQAGAVDYIIKPAEPDDLVNRVSRVLNLRELKKENESLRAAVSSPMLSCNFVSNSDLAQEILFKVAKVCDLETTVIITGESGTGKSTIARMIHQAGKRSSGPFITINCASLPRELLEAELFGHEKGAFTGAVSERPGRAEIADGGTLFLDEIGDMPIDLQPKLLTFLQDRTFQRIGSNRVRRVNVRVISATHQDLALKCEEKGFREDLYYRLNVISINMPSLNSRLDDIPEIANQILSRTATQSGGPTLICDSNAMRLLLKHSWRGNIRELENVLARAAAFCDGKRITCQDISFSEIGSHHKSDEANSSGSFFHGKTLSEIERLAVIETLEIVGGNKAEAARQL